MTGKTHDSELDALRSDIAGLRDQLAELAAGMKHTAGTQTEQPRAAVHREGPAHTDEGLGAWADLLHKFDASKVQGEKIVKDLAAEVEQRPLVSILAAFGLGYIIAKLWYQENKQ